jgi:deoxyribodipyrimidine photo-lyase
MIEFYDSSKFSAWLAIGVLSPAEIFKNILDFEDQHGSNSSTYWLKLELLWREYFRWMAETNGDLFFKSEGLIQEYIEPEFNPQDFETFLKWINGNTQHPFINANMVELKTTGFMSNRGRQNVASYLTHELNLPWHWGAKWFESQLIDYDPASNYGNWQYVSGVGGWGEHKFDYDWQANTYDPEKKYQKYWNSKNK